MCVVQQCSGQLITSPFCNTRRSASNRHWLLTRKAPTSRQPAAPPRGIDSATLSNAEIIKPRQPTRRVKNSGADTSAPKEKSPPRKSVDPQSAPAPALPFLRVQLLAQKLAKRWKGAPPITVVRSAADLPEDLLEKVDAAGARDDVRGIYYDGKVFVIADKMRSRAEIESTLIHEVVGHLGLRALTGERLDATLDKIFGRFAGSDLYRELAWRYYGASFNPLNVEHRREIAEELVAHIAETGEHRSLLSRVIYMINRALQTIGFRTRISDRAELLELIRQSESAVSRDAKMTGDVRLQRNSIDETSPEYQETEAAYGGRDAYERAKASGRTKLEYAQWVQVRTPSFKRSFGDWEISGSKPARSANTFAEAREQAKAFQGKPLTNGATGITATVSRNNLDKMLSSKAVGKSESPATHALAVANLDALFERAVLGWSKPDAANDPNIRAIHRFFAPVRVGDTAMIAKMTVKETVDKAHANGLYSVENVEFEAIKNPAAQWVDAAVNTDSIDLTSIRSAGLVYSMAQSAQDFNPANVSSAVDPDTGEPDASSVNNADIRFSRTPPNAQAYAEGLRKLGLTARESSGVIATVRAAIDASIQSVRSGDLARRAQEGIFDGLVGLKRAEERAQGRENNSE